MNMLGVEMNILRHWVFHVRGNGSDDPREICHVLEFDLTGKRKGIDRHPVMARLRG